MQAVPEYYSGDRKSNFVPVKFCASAKCNFTFSYIALIEKKIIYLQIVFVSCFERKSYIANIKFLINKKVKTNNLIIINTDTPHLINELRSECPFIL